MAALVALVALVLLVVLPSVPLSEQRHATRHGITLATVGRRPRKWSIVSACAWNFPHSHRAWGKMVVMSNPFAYDPRDSAPRDDSTSNQGGAPDRIEARHEDAGECPRPTPPGSVPPGAGAGPVAPKLSDDENRTMQRLVMHFTLLMFATIVTSALTLPVRLVALVFAVWAFVVGVQAFKYAWGKQIRGAFIGFLGLGITLTALLGLTVLTIIPRWNIEMDYQTCRSQAITVQAKSACDTAFQESIKNYLKTTR